MLPPPLKSPGAILGGTSRPYVIAEMSANHNGDLNAALRIIEEAKRVGADAVKLQTYRPDTITLDSDLPEFQIHDGLWKGRTLYELYDEAHTPWEWHEPLFAKGRANLASPSSPRRSTDGGRFPRELESACLQDRLVRDDRPAAGAARGGDRQAGHHVHRHGKPGGDRRIGRRLPQRWRPRPGSAPLCERLSDAGGAVEPAPHPGTGGSNSAARSGFLTTRSASRWRSPPWRSAPA